MPPLPKGDSAPQYAVWNAGRKDPTVAGRASCVLETEVGYAGASRARIGESRLNPQMAQ